MRASTTGAAFLPSPRISSIPKPPGRKSPASNPKPNHAASPCGNVSRCIRNLSAVKDFFLRAFAAASMQSPMRTDTRVARASSPASDVLMPASKKLEITALAGGVGASKLLLGLYEVMDPRDLTIIVNTGDDIVLHGLKISPDLDIVTYTLAGIVDSAKGWGFRGETFHALKRLAHFGRANWFNLGDRDLATHIHRTAMLAEGKSLSEAAESIRTALGVKSRILPMSDSPVPTIIDSNEGPLHFQEYLVKRRNEPIVKSIRFANVESTRPAPGVLEEKVFAACPIVGGKSLKGPSDKMLAQLGHDSTALGVAKLYADFTGTFVIDPADESHSAAISALGLKVAILPTVMKTLVQKRKLARAILNL